MPPAKGKSFLHLLEVYVDDFIQLEQMTDAISLHHCIRALLHGIHSVSPPGNIGPQQ